MRLEKSRDGKILLNGIPTSQRTLKQVCRRFFTAESWERLMRDLDTYGKVHAAFIFVDKESLLRDRLDRANKKIAALEKALAKRSEGKCG